MLFPRIILCHGMIDYCMYRIFLIILHELHYVIVYYKSFLFEVAVMSISDWGA